MVNIQEQKIEDSTNDMTVEIIANDDGEASVILWSPNLPYGNREYQFNKNGQYVGAGTYLKPE